MNGQDNIFDKLRNDEHAFDLQHESVLQQYTTILMRRKWTILLIAGIVFGAVALYTFLSDPVYEASTLVLIDVRQNGNTNPITDVSGTVLTNKITNELETMKSYSNAVAVAEALIQRRYIDDSTKRVIRILRIEENNPFRDSLAREPIIVQRLRRAVEFTPVRESDMIRIAARSTDPSEAALLANLYTAVYTSNNLSASRTRSQALKEFLESQLNSKRSELDTTESNLQRYMRQSGIVSLDVEATRSVEHLSQLEAQREALEVEKRSVQKTLASYREELKIQEPNAAVAIGESNDSYIRMLQEQLGRLEVQRDVTIAQNPGAVQEKLYSDKLIEINGQIKEIKKKLDERTKAYLKTLLPTGSDPNNANSSFLSQLKAKIIDQQIELQGIDARISALNGVIAESERKFNTIPQKSMTLARLQRERLSTEKLYLLVEEKYNEASIKEKSEFGSVNVVDKASVPMVPVSPRVAVNLVFGLVLGFGLGFGVVILRALFDRYVRTPEDLKRCGFMPLSTISAMNGESKRIERELGAVKHKRFLDTHLLTHYRPLSPLAESYRHLRTKLQYVQVDKPLQCIVITSCNPKEGKTTTIANLAVTFAQADKKVLIVDADMRRSSLHMMFGLRNSIGLNEVLFGRVPSEEAIQKDVLPHLDVLTCGLIPPNPAEILGSDRMKEFIQEMRLRYDFILFDAPPLLAVTDAAVLATQSDGVMLVASAGETHAAGLRRIAEFLQSVGVKLLGVVLNRFDAKKAYGNSYSSSASYHYGYYGYDLSTRKKEHQVKS
ncbi:MAG TPA: polysaccharide biosynthesis tyrosine autokinase [Bacteroidota bacterium]|nr:polysaccharide biosynthesis tyrosine autokinase [Bacteroidota bacterium]